MAIACAVTGGVVCFPTAGVVWALRKSPRVSDVSVVIAEGRRVDPVPGVRIVRSCDLPDCDLVRRPDGIAITSPPRTAFDAAWTLSNDDLESLIEHGIHRQLFTLAGAQRMAPIRCVTFTIAQWNRAGVPSAGDVADAATPARAADRRGKSSATAASPRSSSPRRRRRSLSRCRRLPWPSTCTTSPTASSPSACSDSSSSCRHCCSCR